MQDEKRRKFKEALRRIYFPAPPPPSPPRPPPSPPPVDPSFLGTPRASPPSSPVLDVSSTPRVVFLSILYVGLFVCEVEDDALEERDDEEGSSSEAGTTQKLTRSQRKRLRKRKLKEAAAAPSPALPGRRKIIGPMLPAPDPTPGTEHPEDLAGVTKKKMDTIGIRQQKFDLGEPLVIDEEDKVQLNTNICASAAFA
ncbi:hypothetical protein Taro_019104 [Colocasia esculenta]|uniref:Uncharacterized protein n=1 Tax=Colocasia esculenta TaxID=4460 RepID=A0A843USX5_COLES|nr:hypothetical protein [Colocasia esculenta]